MSGTNCDYPVALALTDSLNVRLDGPQDSRIVWVVADPVGGDGWSQSNVVMVERLLPHLRQFAHVRQALVEARALGSSLAMLLENTRFGVIQLDRFGRIAAANDPAGALLREGDGLHDQNGRLRAAVPEVDDALQGLLARALPPFGGQAASGSMMVSHALVLPRLVVHVTPVNCARVDGDASRVRALVLAIDPTHRDAVAPEFVAATLGLTLAESHIAVSLAQGRTVRDIALATGRSAGTVRWHMKNIFAKYRISRQMELVQLVLSLADLPQIWPWRLRRLAAANLPAAVSSATRATACATIFLSNLPNVGGEGESIPVLDCSLARWRRSRRVSGSGIRPSRDSAAKFGSEVVNCLRRLEREIGG